MVPALGCGPRDTLMVLIGKKVPKVPIGTVRFCIEVVAMVVGVLLGAITIAVISKSLSMVGINPFWQQALKGGIILVVISMFLTLIAGIIPSRSAAKKDPVIALRSE